MVSQSSKRRCGPRRAARDVVGDVKRALGNARYTKGRSYGSTSSGLCWCCDGNNDDNLPS